MDVALVFERQNRLGDKGRQTVRALPGTPKCITNFFLSVAAEKMLLQDLVCGGRQR